MDIVLLTSDYNLNANVAMARFLGNPLLKKHQINVKGIVMSSPYGGGRKTFSRMKQFMKKCGWRFSVNSILLEIWHQLKIKIGKYLLADERRQYFDIDELAEKRQIPFLRVKHINDKAAKVFIAKNAPDYLVSCHLLQIADEEVLGLPAKGAINVHPALTQKHRGTFTAFWSLLSRWKNSGATVHFMTREVDKGKVIIQKKFRICSTDTLHCINQKAAKISASLLVKALIKLKRKERCGYLIKKLGQYFEMPHRNAVQHFYMKGKSLIKAADLFMF